jgi:hypothetical protein
MLADELPGSQWHMSVLDRGTLLVMASFSPSRRPAETEAEALIAGVRERLFVSFAHPGRICSRKLGVFICSVMTRPARLTRGYQVVAPPGTRLLR